MFRPMLRSKNKFALIITIIYLVIFKVFKFCNYVIMNSIYVVRTAALNVFLWARHRKLYSALAVLTVIFLCILWSGKFRSFHSSSDWFLATHSTEESRVLDSCIESVLSTYKQSADAFDVFLNHVPTLPNEKFLFPFVGNGYIGAEVESYAHVHIKHGRTLSIPIPYLPIISVSQDELAEKRAVLLDVLQGLTQQFQCFQVDQSCISVNSLTYAHRRRTSLLVQEISMSNPTLSRQVIHLESQGFQLWPSANVTKIRLNFHDKSHFNCTLGSAIVPASDSSASYKVVVLVTDLTKTLTLESRSTINFVSLTSIQYEIVEKSGSAGSDDSFQNLRKKAIKELKEALLMRIKSLRDEHTSAWLSLWNSGFYMSYSLASGVVNGNQINKTMYYVLSNAKNYFVEMPQDQKAIESAKNFLFRTDRCYGGHHTLQNMRMWTDVMSVHDVLSLANIWLITLEKQGCGTMIKAGAEGVIQAMVLSYGPLRFSDSHLEFNTKPSDLHRDLHFRRINYGSDTHVNISVRVDSDNKAFLYISLDRNNLTYYACDAGCLDPPVRLSKDEVRLPVKLTEPITPILYITSDLQHMDELKHAIHVQSVDEAPAHEHQVMIMHKHGHKWGGLPMMFWITITLLILIFHLFLFKLVFNEYCSSSSSSPEFKSSQYNRYNAQRRHV